MSDEYEAQCWGGPEHGNLISARVEEWAYTQTSEMRLDGPTGPITRQVIHGKYAYRLHKMGEAEGYMWMWSGPGADGDTIERLRLR